MRGIGADLSLCRFIQLLSILLLFGCGSIGVDTVSLDDGGLQPTNVTADRAATGLETGTGTADSDTHPGDTGSPSDTETESFGAHLTEADTVSDTGTDNVVEYDTITDTGVAQATDTAIDTGGLPETDTATDTGVLPGTDTATDTDGLPGTDTATDTGVLPGTDTAIDTGVLPGTDTAIDTCTDVIPAGTSIIDTSEWGYYGYATVEQVSVSGQSFSQAWRCTTTGPVVDPISSQFYFDTTGVALTGDHLVATFWTRCLDSLTGSCRTGLVFEENHGEFGNSLEYYSVVDSQWRQHQVPFVAAMEHPSGEAHLIFRLGYSDQTIEIFVDSVDNYGPDVSLGCLPDTTNIWDEVTIVSPPPDTAVADFQFVHRLEFNGRPEPTVDVDGLPEWLAFDESRYFSGVPPYTDIGLTDPITVTVSNGVDSDVQTFQINVVVDDTLEGHWPLDQNSGTTAFDISGKGNNGAFVGEPQWLETDGQVGGALRLNGYDGTVDYVEIPASASLENVQESDYTLSAWVRPNRTPPGNNDNENSAAFGVLIKEHPSTSNHLGLWYHRTDTFQAGHEFDSGYASPTSTNVALGSYFHVAVRVNNTLGYMHLYLDGDYQEEIPFTPPDPTTDYGNAPWRIGIASPGAVNYAMISDADIDDVRIYSRSLSQNEIRALAGWYD